METKAYAKVNFTLEVFAERADGYHALRSLVVPVSLCDTIEVESAPGGSISSDSPYPDDLCVKAAVKLRSAAIARGIQGAENLGAAISIVKRIPAGGGLGGGSADAAATLKALDSLWGLGFPRAALLEVAAQVGSDVPSLVHGGAVIMEGRGEIVSPFMDFAPFWLVLANPGVSVPTKKVFAAAQARLTNDTRILHNIRSALERRDLMDIASAMVNDLASPAQSLYPEISGALDALRDAGVCGPMMSGSGSTVFGLVPDEARGREIAALLEAKGLKAWCVHTFCPVM